MESAHQREGTDEMVGPRTSGAPRVVGSADRQLVSKKVSFKVDKYFCLISFFITGFA